MFGISKIYIYIAAAVVIALFTWHYKSTLDQNKILKAEIKTANASIEVLNATKLLYDDLVNKEGEKLDEIENSPKEDDGVIAPILRRTLNSL